MNIFEYIAPSDYWLAWVVISITGLFLFVLLVILFARARFFILDSRRKRFRSRLLTLLAKTVNHPEEWDENLKRLNRLVQRKWHQEILLDQLITMCYSFQGSYATRARYLFDLFGLLELSRAKLKSVRWERIIEGIIELSVIGEEDGYGLIVEFLDHKNYHVRREAKIAIVEMGKIKGLIAMHKRMGIMSRWTFISILSILHRSAFKLKEKDLAILKKSDSPSMQELSTYLEKYAVAYR